MEGDSFVPSENDVLNEKPSEENDVKEVINEPKVDNDDDDDSVDFLNSSSAELIVLDESGGEDESANSKTLKVVVSEENADSDIEIVSDRASPLSTGSIDSLPYEDENPCSCKGCHYKKKLHYTRKKFKKAENELRKMKRENGYRVIDIGQSATVEIKFSDKFFFTKYAEEIEKFVKSVTDTDRVNDVTSNSMNQPGCSFKLYDSFCVDRKGFKETPFHMEWTQPTYEQQFSDPLTEKSYAETPEKTTKSRNSCFNCLGDHMIFECPIPHDRQRIANNRNEFMSKKPSMNYSRYHIEDISRYSKIRPGNISHQLRRALGLEYTQLPMFIYKMRNLGYPPAWLKEAEIHGSGLTVYDSEGKAIDGNLEDGEVDNSHGNKVRYDAEKLVAFPGFNVTAPRDTIDEYQKLGFPPMQLQHMKEFREMTMTGPEPAPYKRKSLQLTTSPAKRQKVSDESQDTDVEEIQTVLVGDEPSSEFIVPQPPTPESRLISIPSDGTEDSPCNNALMRVASSDSSTPSSSPTSALSLKDLEDAKQKLMVELNDSVSVEDEVKTSATDTQSSDDECRTPKGITPLSSSIAMHLGSPAIYNSSSYSTLPNAEKFAIGISEHLHYENLPNSTGNFDKMRGVLQDLRKKMTALRQ